MLSAESVEQIKKGIREINKLRSIDEKVEKMIEMKDEIRSQVNEELDDLFAYLDLSNKRKKKKSIEEYI